jgi:Na+/H+ antiporter NhaC
MVCGEAAGAAPQPACSPLSVSTFPGLLSLCPLLFVVLLAVGFRDVYLALLGGCVVAAFLLSSGSPYSALLALFSTYAVPALLDPISISILLFSFFLSGAIGLMSRAGSIQALGELISSVATDSRRAQVASLAFSLLTYFDEYASILMAGSAMRPTSRDARLSPEKFAFLIDSMGSPVSSFLIVTSWIPLELKCIAAAMPEDAPEPYVFLLSAIPFAAYQLLMPVFSLTVALARRDFGPMAAAERRARSGIIDDPQATSAATASEDPALTPAPNAKPRASSALIVIFTLIGATLSLLVYSGYLSRAADYDLLDTQISGLRFLPNSDATQTAIDALVAERDAVPFDFLSLVSRSEGAPSMLNASFLMSLAAMAICLADHILTPATVLGAWTEGFKLMVGPYLLLTLAWSLGDLLTDLGTASYLVSLVGASLPVPLLPATLFLLATATAFFCASAWTTLILLVPVALSLALTSASPYDSLPLACFAATLSGSVFGCNISPITDTTVLASLLAGTSVPAHLKTQLPYVCTVAAFATAAFIAAGFGVPPGVFLPVCCALLVTFIYTVSKRTPVYCRATGLCDDADTATYKGYAAIPDEEVSINAV